MTVNTDIRVEQLLNAREAFLEDACVVVRQLHPAVCAQADFSASSPHIYDLNHTHSLSSLFYTRARVPHAQPTIGIAIDVHSQPAIRCLPPFRARAVTRSHCSAYVLTVRSRRKFIDDFAIGSERV